MHFVSFCATMPDCVLLVSRAITRLLNTRRLHKHRGVEVECPPSPADILFQEEEEKPGLLDGDTPSLGEDGIFSSTISAVAEDSCLSTPSPSGVTPPASIVSSKRRMGGSASSSADSSPLWMSHQSPSAFSTHFPPAFSVCGTSTPSLPPNKISPSLLCLLTEGTLL